MDHEGVGVFRGHRDAERDPRARAGRGRSLLALLPDDLRARPLLETHTHDIDQILREALEHELEGIAAYKKLLKHTEGKSVVLEEYARKMVHGEETHVMDIEKMLRRPGKLEPAR